MEEEAIQIHTTREDLLTDYAREYKEQFDQALEEACERALQGGQHGVLVVQHQADVSRETITGSFSIGVNPLVPFGHIFWAKGTDPKDIAAELRRAYGSGS